MKAIYLDRKAEADSLLYGEVPQPLPAAGDVLVKIHATAVTPSELQWFPTFNLPGGQPRPFPIILSHEFSGVIAALGDHVSEFNIGDAVYGLNDWFANGAQAEFCVAPATMLALKPKSLSHVEASVVPVSALTAWQALFEKTNLSAGQRILIHGAAGGVGVFAVQLARRCGARVIATASAANRDFVRSLGAHETIDYQATRFEKIARDLDVVFDGVGGDTLQRSWDVLKKNGKLVTIAAPSEGAVEPRVRDAFMLVRADGTQLKYIADLIDNQELSVFVEASFPLAQARAAFARARQGKMRGKIALVVAS
jgi:NADPH:quinone reductase-like Zn-dependent oxidoreductase